MKKVQKISLLFFLFTSWTMAYSQDGKELFTATCASCHTIGKGTLVGPDLKGVHAKYKQPWLVKWIKSSQTMVQNKDPKAVALFEQYNEIIMPDITLSDGEIKELLAYIRTESGDDQAASAPGSATATTAKPDGQPQSTATNAPAAAAVENSSVSSNAGSVASSPTVEATAKANAGGEGSSLLAMKAYSWVLIVICAVLLITVLVLSRVISALSAAATSTKAK